MKQIKSLYRRLLLPLLGGLALTACEKDNGEETRISEFGPYKKEIIAPWKGGTGSIPVLANQPYDIELINPDNGWLTLDTEGRGTHFTGDDYFKFQATTNDGFPRMEGIRLSESGVMMEAIKRAEDDQGYILRRLIRRAIRFAGRLGIEEGKLHLIA